MKFITFEGLDGSGKTTVLEAVVIKLKALNINVHKTREPGGNAIAEEIRDFILNKNHAKIDNWTEVLLYLAARRQHYIENIVPEQKTNKIIICDRFIDSTVAYQGYGRNLNVKQIDIIQKFILDSFIPDLTIFFELKPEKSLLRTKQRNRSQENNRLDQEALSFYQRVYFGYQKIINENPQRFAVVDSNCSFEEVVEEVTKIIVNFLEK